MKKKVLYGAALALFASVSMGTLQSCKDDLSDLRQEVVYNQGDLIKRLNDLKTQLEAQIASCGTTCDGKITALQTQINNLSAELANKADKGDVTANAAEIAALKNLIQDLQGQVADKTVLDELQNDLTELENNLTQYKADAEAYADAAAGNVKTELAADIAALSADINNQLVNIDARINNLSADYDEQFKAINKEITDIKENYTGLTEKYNQLAADLAEVAANYQTQQGIIEALNKSVDDLWADVFGPAGLSDQLSMVRTELKDDIKDLSDKYDQLAAENKDLWEGIYGPGGLSDQMSQYYTANKEAIDQLSADQQDLWEKIFAPGGLSDQMSQYYNANKDAIETVAASTQELWESIFGENGLTTLMSQMFMATQADIDELKASNTELWESIYGEGGLTTQMSQYYTANKAAIEEVAEDLEGVKTSLNNLIGRMDDLITGILIQGTDNPVFGNFSLPLGIKANMLFNWYGYNNLEEFNFPNAGSEYNYYEGDPVLTYDDLRALNPDLVEVKKGYLGEVELGKLYLTVNPLGHNFDNTALKLETTNGEQLPYELRVNKSDEKLFWGYTRGSVEGNGFYAANVVMPATVEAVKATKIEIEDGLKTAAKDLLKDRTKRNAVNMLKAVYDQMSDMLPMYGVRYDWTSNGQNYGVLSNYDLAVATARPLSYSFLYGKHVTKHLKTYGHINNILDNLIDKDKFKFELNTTFKIDDFEIKFNDLEFNLNVTPDIQLEKDIVITIEIPEIEVKDTETGKVIGKTDKTPVDATLTGEDLKPLIDAIADGFSSSISQMNDDLNKQINQQIREKLIAGIQDQVNKMLDQIRSQINQMLADLEGQINDQIGDIIDDLMSSITNKTQPIFDKVNKAIDIYNKVAGKINNVLDDPNHYLQVAMFYKGNGTVGLLSNSKKSPTVFKNAGGDAISLYASSYSAEILAPAYLKYIAVSNVYNADGTVNTAEQANIAAINQASGLNKVYPGVTKRVGVAAKQLKKGLTYEIVYQGVDYSGKTSTQKFYIKVK